MNNIFDRRSRRVLEGSLVIICGVITVPNSVGLAHAQQACTITTEPGASLLEAKDQYAEACPDMRRDDCDPFNGGWMCSSENIPLNNPFEVIPEPESTPEPEPEVTPAPEVTPSPESEVTAEPETNNSDLSFIDSREEAARFLMQASFGGSIEEIDALVGGNASEWIEDQMALDKGIGYVRRLDNRFPGRNTQRVLYNSAYLWDSMIDDRDELRLRMAFALSQIFVSSDQGLISAPYKVAYYWDILENNAFGNFRALLEDITYSPMMAHYLTYFRNRKASERTGREPDENYAREVMQLFTIGLTELNLDGTEKLGGTETYDNDDIIGLSRVFTGLSHDQTSFSGEFFNNTADSKRLKMFAEHHSEKVKEFLGTSIPAGTSGDESIRIALDTLFEHPNVAPFFSRQLIQRFTSSNPVPEYVERVSRSFNSGSYVASDGRTFGTGNRGDLAATLAAVLLDDTVHSDVANTESTDGKVREPILRLINLLQAFNAKPNDLENNEPKLRNTSSGLDALGQHPGRPPSVFNFYRPGFVAANTETGNSGLTVPELQIVNDGSAIGITNFLTEFTVERTGDTGSNVSLVPDYRTEIQLADDAQVLVSHLNLLLTAGSLGDYNEQRIVDIVQSIDVQDSNDLIARVHAAVVAIVASNASATLR